MGGWAYGHSQRLTEVFMLFAYLVLIFFFVFLRSAYFIFCGLTLAIVKGEKVHALLYSFVSSEFVGSKEIELNQNQVYDPTGID